MFRYFLSVLGVFAKLQNAAISFFMSIHQSVCIEQLGSTWMNFHKILHLSIFQKSVNKIQVSLKSDTNNRYFT